MTTDSDQDECPVSRRLGYTLAEAIEAGIFGHRNVEAVRKRFQRDPEAPAPAVPGYKGGPAHRYSEDDLREYAEKSGMACPNCPGDGDVPVQLAASPPMGSGFQAGTWCSAADLGFSKYEVSADGFGPDQQPVRRIGTGKPLAVSLNNNGYLRVKPYDDDGRQQTIPVHTLVLLTYAGPRPAGLECRHLDDDPWNNRWRPGDEEETRAAGGNLIWGTKKENAADIKAAGTGKRPAAFPCVNHDRCGGMVVNAGSRCLPCVTEVGVRAGAMLREGLGLKETARRLGYTNQEWVHKLAVRHGGYTGTRAEALISHRRPWLQRVMTTVRHRLKVPG